MNGCYGYRRLHAVLKGLGRSVSEKVIRRVMKEERLVVRNIRRRHYNSYLGEISPAAPNLINRNFHAEKPNEKWLTDITEFRLPAGKVYLSPIIDCFDGMGGDLDDRDISQRPVGQFYAGCGYFRAAGRRTARPPFGPGRALPLAGLDPAYESGRPAALHVGERLFSGQRRLRGILWAAEERDVLWSFLGGRIPAAVYFHPRQLSALV